MHGTVELIVGPMFSGKSTELQRRIRRLTAAKKSYLLLTHHSDKRYFGDADVMGTHDLVAVPARKVTHLSEVSAADLECVSAVLIDEAQFFVALASYVRQWSAQGIDVVVAALNGTSEREPFAEISPLYALMTHVTLLNAICTGCGHDAPYSHCLQAKSDVMLIGGPEAYTALCPLCFAQAQAQQ